MRSAEGVVLGAVALCTLAQAGRAGPVGYDCLLARGEAQLRIGFDIDLASFAAPLDARDPPRRQVSRVTLGRETFEAEALMTESGTHGFWAPGRGMLLTVAPDGAARLSDAGDTAWLGHCEETGT